MVTELAPFVEHADLRYLKSVCGTIISVVSTHDLIKESVTFIHIN
jgi:hypothetical protein